MGTTVDAGEQHCSDTRDAPGDHSVFLCDLGGLGVWMSFLAAAAGDMYSCSSVCNLISFRGSREWCSVFAGLSIGLMWPNTAHAAGPGCALLEPVAGSSYPCPRSESAGSTRSSFAFELCSNKVRLFQLVAAHKRLCC